MFKKLTNESLLTAYLIANKKKLGESFIKALLDEIIKRDIYDLLKN